jgi:hypothetical protein
MFALVFMYSLSHFNCDSHENYKSLLQMDAHLFELYFFGVIIGVNGLNPRCHIFFWFIINGGQHRVVNHRLKGVHICKHFNAQVSMRM